MHVFCFGQDEPWPMWNHGMYVWNSRDGWKKYQKLIVGGGGGRGGGLE